jgi:hypothetical protein
MVQGIALAPQAGAFPPPPDYPVGGLIAAKYKALGGSAGPLGHPTSKEMDSREGKGRYQTFQHGVIGWSPSTGPKSVQALYSKNGELNFEWGDTSPFNYDYFIVRWDLNGKNVGQQDIKHGSRTSGRWVTRPTAAGKYRLVVEGRDTGVLGGKSRQGWSNPLYLDIVPPKPWAVVLCKFSDQPTYEPHPPGFYRERFTEVGAGKGNEFDYFKEVTYGTLNMTGSKVFGWFPMPKHKTQDLAGLKFPNPGRGTLAEWGIEVARANRIDLKPFYGVIVVFNAQTDSGAAGRHQVVLGYTKADWSPTFNLHEIGHGFELNHSWLARPDTEYGDQWDIMSAMNVWSFNNKLKQATGPGMNACNLNTLGCIPASRIWRPNTKSGSQTITLVALNRPNAKGYLMASILPSGGSTSKTSYTIEFRQKKGWDAGIPQDTVLVHEVRSNGLCYLLSRIERADPASIQVLPGQDFSVPERKLSIRVVRFDSAASTAQVSITLGK